MSCDLILKPTCCGCGTTTDLYGSNCKHLTLCSNCGKSMAEKRAKCNQCGTILTRLIREYNVRASSGNDKNYFIGRFTSGLPDFSKKKSAENKWTLQREGLQGGSNSNHALREESKNKAWMLEDETGQSQYYGQLEGSQSATYYLLQKMQSNEFVAIPAGPWYNFTKVAQYKQLTLEEAEEKMKYRRKLFDGYERWMMKKASNGASAFPTFDPNLVKDTHADYGGKKEILKEEGNASDKGEDDLEEETQRKARLGLNKKAGDDDGDDDDGPTKGDFDDPDDNIDIGDDWEHEEIFTDDDEAVGNDPEEREDLLALEHLAPPEIKQNDDNEDDANEGEGGLSKSGRELKKLLGRAIRCNDSDPDEEDDSSAIKKKDEEEDNNYESKELDGSCHAKPATGGSSCRMLAKNSAKLKREISYDTKPLSAAPEKKVKTGNDLITAPKETVPENGGVPKSTTPSSKAGTSAQGTPAQGLFSVEEVRAVLLQKAPVSFSDLLVTFRARLKSREDKNAFGEILRSIAVTRRCGDERYVVLREQQK